MKARLLPKTPIIKYTQYKGDVLRLSKFAPYTVEEVAVEINGQKDNVRKITTFRDSKGNITERVFDYPGRPIRNRLYSSEYNDIGIYESVKSTTKQDYELNRSVVKLYKDVVCLPKANRFMFWNHKSTTVDHAAYNLDKDELILTQVKVKNKSNSSQQTHSFVQYPRIRSGKKTPEKLKQLKFTVRGDNSVVESTIEASDKNIIPQNDSYLGYRALTMEDSKIPFVRRYLRERNMADKGVSVEPQFNPRQYTDENFSALFDAEDGSVKFNKDHKILSKGRLANTSRHEVEHSWHYFLQASLNGGGTPWQTEMAQKFDKIKNKRTLKEAKNYDRSINTYVHYYEDAARYRRNYIEIKAREAGAEAQEAYDFEGQDIRRSFTHIPSKFL